jgi:uncharacterized protein
MNEIQNEKIALAQKLVANHFSDDTTGHDIAHIKRVVRVAVEISESISADVYIVTLAAWLHEMLDHKFFDSTEQAKENLLDFFKKNDFETQEIEQVLDIIEHQSYSQNIEQHYELSIEGQAVQDADRLDAIGAIGIARTFAYGGSKHRAMYNGMRDEHLKLSANSYKNSEDTSIQHFYDKLLKLKDLMNTAKGRELADQRHEFMLQFLEEFYLEWDGE